MARRILLYALALGAVLSAAAAGYWWLGIERRSFYTDDAAIRADAGDAPLRDVLWRPAEPLPGLEDAAVIDIALSPDGGTLYASARTPRGDTDLFFARRAGDRWSPLQPITALNTPDNELAPATSPDGEELYFASDRPGGVGGLDLWRARLGGDGWMPPAPLPEPINSRHDESDPHPHAAGGSATLLFASDRPSETPNEGAAPTGFDIYSHGDADGVLRVDRLSSAADDRDPAVSPAGDFVYLASDRASGLGGFDLYRARRSGDGAAFAVGAVQNLGASINSSRNERSPVLALEGFAVLFASAEGDALALRRAVSREVYLARVESRADLLGLLPWILLALALVLLLALLRRLATTARWQGRLATLGLMAKCVLLSLLIHGGIMALLAALTVPPTVGDLAGDEAGVRVALSSSAVRQAAADQLRPGAEAAALQQASVPAAAAPSVPSPVAASAAVLEAAAMAGPSGELAPTRSAMDASSSPSSAVSVAALGDDVPAPAGATESLSLPESSAPAASDASEPALRAGERPSATDAVAPARAAADGGATQPVQIAAADAGSTLTMPLAAAGPATRDADGASAHARADARDLPDAAGLAPIGVDLALPGDPSAVASAAEPAIDAPSVDRGAVAARPDVASVAQAGPRIARLDAASAGVRAGALEAERSVQEASTMAAWPMASADLPPPPLGDFEIALGVPDAADADASIAEADWSPADAMASLDLLPDRPLTGGSTASLDRVRPAAGATADEMDEWSHASSEATPDVASDVLAGIAPPAAMRFGDLDLSLPEAIEHRYALIGVVLDASDDEPIAGALVRLDLEGVADASMRTDDRGGFELAFDDIPDNAAVTASAPGYTPGALNVSQRDVELERRLVFRLEPIDPYVVVLERQPEVHHLGNDEFSGRINSQFQRRSEGLVLELPFEITPEHRRLRVRGAELRLFVKGSQAPNPLRINGEEVGTLRQSPRDGSFGEQSIPVPLRLLRAGGNVLEIESVARPGSDKDDYEFVNVRLILIPADLDAD